MKFTPQQIVATYEAKGYRLFQDGRCNTFGIRSKASQAGEFDDWLGVLRFEGGSYVMELWRATCDPGLYYLADHLLDESGCAILKEGQYKGAYALDLHRGKYLALCQRKGEVTIYRDANRNKTLDRAPDHQEEGWFGINIHMDSYSEKNEAGICRKASAGCQVFAVRADFYEALALWKDHRDRFENTFDYTLLNEAEIEAATAQREMFMAISQTTSAPAMSIAGAPVSMGNVMSLPQQTLALGDRRDYAALFTSARIQGKWAQEVSRIADRIMRDKERYAAFASVFNPALPWFYVACIHELESGGNWATHIANGDPLEHRTVHVPVGLPKAGNPPFAWEEAAMEELQPWDRWQQWTICDFLYRAEDYNGFGYLKHGIKSPYLWSGTQHYTQGKYTSDGEYDPDAVSDQAGVVAILRELLGRWQIKIV